MTYLIQTESQLQNFLIKRNLNNFEEIYDREKKTLRYLNLLQIPYIFDLKHLSEHCFTSEKQLFFFIHNKRKSYSSFQIPKKNGSMRRIDAPSKNLKIVQRWILQNILYKLIPSEQAHGFIPNRSIVTNAEKHIEKPCVLCIDLSDFFQTIRLEQVKAYFNTLGYNPQMALDLAELCTFDLKMVQGAPTSPMLSNLISIKMDEKLEKICNKRKLTYTRYADDIAISGTNTILNYKMLIKKAIETEGFEINEEKTRLLTQGCCQKIAGVVVNKKLSVGRKRKRLVRAIVHNIIKNGPVAENKTNDPFFKQRIYGMVSHIIQVEPELGKKLKNKLSAVDWSEYEEMIFQIREKELQHRSQTRMSSVKINDRNSERDARTKKEQTDSHFFMYTLRNFFSRPVTYEEITRVITEFEKYRKTHILGRDAKFLFIRDFLLKVWREEQLIETRKYEQIDQYYFELEKKYGSEKPFHELKKIERHHQELAKIYGVDKPLEELEVLDRNVKRDACRLKYLQQKFGGYSNTIIEFEELEKEYVEFERILGSERVAARHIYFKEKFGVGKSLTYYERKEIESNERNRNRDRWS